MAMNKKEKEYLESVETKLALRFTDKVEVDVIPSEYNELVTGYGYNAYTKSIDVECSDSISHSIGRVDETRSQGCRMMYSTKLMALKALRNELELKFANELRAIDLQINSEQKD